MQTKHIKILIALFLMTHVNVKAANDGNDIEKSTATELLLYDVYYNYAAVWVLVGEFELTTKIIEFGGKPCYNFLSQSRTNESWKWIYEASSTYDVISTIDKLQPIQYYQSTNYGNHQSAYTYNFESDSILMYCSVDGKADTNKLANNHLVYDALTAVQYARTLDFSQLNEGDSLQIKVLHGNELLDQKIFFNGIVNLSNDDGNVPECYKFSSIIRNNDIISDSQAAEVWVATTTDRTPVKIVVKIAVGSVEIILAD